MSAPVDALCIGCGSPRVAHFRLDSDWGHGGDWTQVNQDAAYTAADLADFRDNERHDIECYVCCACGSCFDRIGGAP